MISFQVMSRIALSYLQSLLLQQPDLLTHSRPGAGAAADAYTKSLMRI